MRSTNGPFSAISMRSSTAALSGPRPAPRQRLIGLAAVLLLVGAGRWGAYLGAPSAGIFLTDILLASALVRWLTRERNDETAVHVHALLPLFLAYVVVRVAFGVRLDAEVLRDAAPFLYSVVGFLGARLAWSLQPERRQAAARAFRLALVFHLAWVLVALLLPLSALVPQVSQVPPFTVRPDFDGAMLSVLAALAFSDAVRTKGWLRSRAIALSLVASGCCLALGSRAAILALISCLAFAVWAMLRYAPSRQVLLRAFPALTLVLLSVTAFAPPVLGVERLAASFGGAVETSAQASGQGTQRARLESWKTVSAYMQQDKNRLAVGVGFGPNFMQESGALYRLVGDSESDVRSPHNFALGAFARLGFAGFCLLAALVFVAVKRAFDTRDYTDDPFVLTQALMIVGIGMVSLLGVVLESPFGAIPFYFAIGAFASQPQRSTELQVALAPARRPRH